MNIFDTADILVPNKSIDLTKWSVVACDQYTSEPEYWEEVEKTVGESKSTLRLILPEIYLGEDERINKINSEMKKYLSDGTFDTIKDSFVLTERTQRNGKKRYGLIGKVDLEEYDFSKGSSSYIRATEGTVIERIPPRVKIRENAPLELPHIIMLIDDECERIIEPLKDMELDTIYDFDLMMNSGHLRGFKVPKSECERIKENLSEMARPEYFRKKYNAEKGGVLLFAVGDGNHSLATAKTVWENLKKTLSEEEIKNHPARYALVEVMNIHDKTLEFEPIHRVVFGNCDDILEELKAYAESLDGDMDEQTIVCIKGKDEYKITVKHPVSNLTVGTLQAFLDDYIKRNGLSIDYIHGEEAVRKLSKENIGFLLPPIEKRQLFETIIRDGVLPRKTFSMGEAEDKRFYMECKEI